ncbi:MAG: HAD family phosphatase, partial [Planctomycetia bacterium]|nr:HAD family phosphatase [Planctomycetia bacterium]
DTQRDTQRNIQAVAFDMDGLMYDTEKVYWKAAEVLLGRRNCPYTEELCDDIMGRPAEYCFRRMIEYYSLNEDWQAMQQESEDIFLSLLEQDGAEPMPGLFVLLDELERCGIPKAVCTSSSRRSMSAVLRKDQLEPRFDFVITSQDIVRGKPDPEIYLTAATRFGFEPASVLVLE